MDLSEFPLCNRPSLMLTVLGTALRDEAALDDCLQRLRGELARAREPMPPVNVEDLLADLAYVKTCLMEAGLLAPAAGDLFTVTRRGREFLAEHRTGIDESLLMQFAGFRDFVRHAAQHPPPEDARSDRYDEGHAAHQGGASFVDNPYPADTVDHLAWENGWFGARDEQWPGSADPPR